jgi:hypothetical protein
LPEGSGVHSLLKTALLLMLLVLIGVNNDEKGARLGGFATKTAKTRQKVRKKPDRPCTFGIPADTMMTPL